MKAVPETSREQPRQEETQPKVAATPAATDAQVEAVATSLFPDIESGKAEGGSRGPFLRVPTTARRRCTCAEGSLVADRGRHNNRLPERTSRLTGPTFQPLDLKGYQKEKALQYVLLRDAYERLYRYESNLHEANVQWREHLNTCYDEFVMRLRQPQRQAEREAGDDGRGRA